MSLLQVTPGVALLSKLGLRIAICFIAIAGLRHYATLYLNYTVPWWAIIATVVFGVPVAIAVNIHLYQWSIERRAKALGARLPPAVRGRWPGNLDVVFNQVKQHREGYPGDGQLPLLKELGPIIGMDLMGEHLTFTIEPNHIKTILATSFNEFEKGEKTRAIFEDFLGTGVFNSDGEMWKFHRSMTRPFFSRERISDFETFGKHTDELILLIKARLREGFSVDFQDAIGRFTMDTATSFLYGKSVDSMSAGLPYPTTIGSPRNTSAAKHPSDVYIDAFNEVQHIVAVRAFRGKLWPLAEIRKNAVAAPMSTVYGFINPLIEAAVSKYESDKSAGIDVLEKDVEDDNLLKHLVRITTDRKIIRDEIVNTLLAGRDTTMGTLTFTLYFLSQYPKVLQKLRAEIAEVFQGRKQKPTYNDIRNMKYLRAILNETMRLYPVVPSNARASIEDALFPPLVGSEDTRPYLIPAGTKVRWNVTLMQRRADLWGPDVEEFDPERWLDDRVNQYLTKNPFIFLPFNAGPRICLGQQFAYNEMSYFLIVFLQEFAEIKLDPSSQLPETRPPVEWAIAQGRKGIEKINPKSHVTAYVNGGLWLQLTEAS